MKSERLIDAIGMIDDRYIEEAHNRKEKKQWNWSLLGKIGLGVACVCLLVTILPNVMSRKGSSPDAYVSNGNYAPTGAAAYDSYVYVDEEAAYEADGFTQRNSDKGSILTDNKKLIVTGDLSMETMDLDEVLKALDKKLEECGGYIQDSSISTYGYKRTYTATIRIPAESYGDFLNDVETTGNVTYYHENTNDITDTYSDINARLTSLKAEEEKVLEFYKEAKDLEELMMVEDRLTQIRYEIDSLETSIRNYDLLVAYSTLYVNVTETKAYTETSVSFWKRLGNAFTNGWQNFIDGVGDFFIDVVYNIWTILFIALIAFVAYKAYRYIKKRRNR